MSLTAANAHLHHFYVTDLPDLVKNLEDEVLDKSRNFMIALIEKEISSLGSATDGMSKANQMVQDTSSQFTTYAFLSDPASTCIRFVLYQFLLALPLQALHEDLFSF